MRCEHAKQRVVDTWGDDALISMHEIQSRPTWIKQFINDDAGQHEKHRIQTYRSAVRQEMRKRGLPINLGT